MPRRLLLPVTLVVAVALWLRFRTRNWGSNPSERARAWPMDSAIPQPTVVTTRAITVRAPTEAVWPWIAQMGELPRAGFYSLLPVERVLGMKVENAERIMPEFQELEVGQALDRRGTMVVLGVEPGRWVVLGPPPEATPDFASTWLIAVVPAGDSTRVVSRVRVRYGRWTPMTLLFALILDPGQLLMEWAMLRGIRRRAEALATA